MSFTDKAGRKIKSGDYIVYGCNVGRCGGLRYGIVLDVCAYPEDKYHGCPVGDRESRLRVIGIDAEWTRLSPEVQRKSYLYFGNRILKLSIDQIPSNVLNLLSKV